MSALYYFLLTKGTKAFMVLQKMEVTINNKSSKCISTPYKFL